MKNSVVKYSLTTALDGKMYKTSFYNLDVSVLTLLSKRAGNVTATLYTASVSEQFKLDLKRFNAQYPAIEMMIFTKSHDRFLIIDDSNVYHIGASLKDLGKKWFAFAKIDLNTMEMIKRLKGRM